MINGTYLHENSTYSPMINVTQGSNLSSNNSISNTTEKPVSKTEIPSVLNKTQSQTTNASLSVTDNINTNENIDKLTTSDDKQENETNANVETTTESLIITVKMKTDNINFDSQNKLTANEDTSSGSEAETVTTLLGINDETTISGDLGSGDFASTVGSLEMSTVEMSTIDREKDRPTTKDFLSSKIYKYIYTLISKNLTKKFHFFFFIIFR